MSFEEMDQAIDALADDKSSLKSSNEYTSTGLQFTGDIDTGGSADSSVFKRESDHLPECRVSPEGGIGMGIASHMARLHKGSIGFCTTMGIGTLFFIWLPLEQRASGRGPSIRTIQTHATPDTIDGTDDRTGGKRTVSYRSIGTRSGDGNDGGPGTMSRVGSIDEAAYHA